jgi:hypothetical protein
MDVFPGYLLQLVILSISLSFMIFCIYRHKPISPKLPPGRKGWPFIGETLEYAKASKRSNPEKFIADRMSNYSPDVFRTSLLGENVAVFCGASGNKFLFSSENEHLTTWLPRSLDQIFLFPTDAEHSTKAEAAKMRAIRPDFLKPEALQRCIPIMDSMSKQHWKQTGRPLVKN